MWVGGWVGGWVWGIGAGWVGLGDWCGVGRLLGGARCDSGSGRTRAKEIMIGITMKTDVLPSKDALCSGNGLSEEAASCRWGLLGLLAFLAKAEGSPQEQPMKVQEHDSFGRIHTHRALLVHFVRERYVLQTTSAITMLPFVGTEPGIASPQRPGSRPVLMRD